MVNKVNEESFGDFFRRLRRSKGFKSQKNLAEASGVSQATISRIEDGTQKPNQDTIKILANALGVEFWDLWPLADNWDGDDLLEPIDKEKMMYTGSDKGVYLVKEGSSSRYKTKEELNENKILDQIKQIAAKHDMDLNDPETFELMNSALDLIKRMRTK